MGLLTDRNGESNAAAFSDYPIDFVYSFAAEEDPCGVSLARSDANQQTALLTVLSPSGNKET